MLLVPLACILLTSCSTEGVYEPIAKQKSEAAYLFKMSNNMTDWEAQVTTNLEDESNLENVRGNGNSLHAHGNFRDGDITFSGTQNNGGTHGSATFDITFGPFGSANVELETVSIISIGDNEVIYGGQISEVIENTIMFPPPPPGFPPPPCDPYELGTYVYFVVKDNGQGNNAPADQVNNLIINSCGETPNGGAVIPWSMFGFSDVDSSTDMIKVND